MSKGSNRRPQKVDDKEMQRKWDKAFPKKEIKDPNFTLKNLVESLAEVISEDEKLTNEYLISNNIDPKKVEASGKEFIEILKKKKEIKK